MPYPSAYGAKPRHDDGARPRFGIRSEATRQSPLAVRNAMEIASLCSQQQRPPGVGRDIVAR
jgi:hypothetical protein